ncbi:MAG: AbrB/MazE/SpoVT family DNA-binding domain-containing protein [Acutalibacteraceae bacterium]
MELAKITSKGQITIPIEIRKKLGVRDGDKVLFIEDGNRIYVTNSSIQALEKAQEAFRGVAEELGIKNDDDIISMIKEVRAERNKN